MSLRRAKGANHTSLGQRPRNSSRTKGKGLKARPIRSCRRGMSRAFSPEEYRCRSFPGRCPGLVWGRAFGPPEFQVPVRGAAVDAFQPRAGTAKSVSRTPLIENPRSLPRGIPLTCPPPRPPPLALAIPGTLRYDMVTMSAPASPPSPLLFFETANAYQKTAALKAGVELGVFTALGGAPGTAGEVASRCSCPERGLRILCDTLTIHGFLLKDGDRYSLTPDSALFLDGNSPACLGGTLKFLLDSGLTDAFAHLTETIREGRLAGAGHGTTAPDHPVWIEFARAMGPMMWPAAQGVAGLVTLDPARETKILDISASHGVFGITLAKTSPLARLTALDWEAVLAVTGENARAAGLGDRFDTITGNAFTADLGTGYDVVLVPNFLHHFNAADCTGFLRRVHAALRPGGQVVIVEFVPNEDRVTPPPAAGFSLVMLGTTPEGDAYTFAEYTHMLTAAGFHDATLHPLQPTAQSVVLGMK